MKEFAQQVLPAANPALGVAGYPPTKVWGYEINDGTQIFGPHYPGFTVEARRGVPLVVTYLNKLGASTLYKPVSSTLPGIIPVDKTLFWCDPLNEGKRWTTYSGPVPATPHLHGGEVQSISDGGPTSWFTPDNDPNFAQITGPAWNQGVTNVYHYPNSQEPATLWFHDHALGATRLNVYAGLAAFYFLRDDRDDGSVNNALGLPAGNYEIELAIQDRMFDTNGQLFFPNKGDDPNLHPFWLPEFFGDVVVVNGKTWPYLEVEPRRYRFRFLDGSNARFYSMFLQNLSTNLPGPPFWVIGADGGLLDSPVKLDPSAAPGAKNLFMAPGERFDVIVDFSGFAGQVLTLLNRAKAPYPAGTAADPLTVGQIMQFRVSKPLNGADNSYDPATLAPLRSTPLVKLANFAAATTAVTPDSVRQLTLVENEGELGPIEVLVNNARMMADITERPVEGNTEVWKIVNLTQDAHPIHLHLVQFQLVSRQLFNARRYRKTYDGSFPGGYNQSDSLTYAPGTYMAGFGPPKPYNFYAPLLGGNPDVSPYLEGKPRPAEPEERGWKDTYKMFPGEVTTVIVRWAPTDLATSTPRSDLLFGFDPSVGPGYVWHCHIVDHEDNEMMRPYAVAPNSARIFSGENASGNIRPLSKSVGFALEQNHPNPFNPSTVIRYTLPGIQSVTLKVFNMLGQDVATLDRGERGPGTHAVEWNAAALPSGVYYYRLQADNLIIGNKMLLIK
jgi:FtsP/CotA-like multicopper oxidase with cupredoxin domain